MEPQNNTPENNLNTPPVGPMPEPLPPEPTPPAPVVPEPPAPESAPAPAPAPTTPPSLETPIPTPENLNQKPATPEKPKKEGNPNTSNYIIAGVSVGVIAIIIVLICGGIFGGWFGGGLVSGFIFGTSSQSSSGDTGPYNTITEKVTKRTSDADSINRKAINALKNALFMYETDHMGQLPEIDGDSEFVSEYSDTETPVEKFYANYFDDDTFVDEFGGKPSIWLYSSYSDFISDYDDEDDLNYMTEITVIYGAICTPDSLEESTSPRAFAINIANADLAGHYCVDSAN